MTELMTTGLDLQSDPAADPIMDIIAAGTRYKVRRNIYFTPSRILKKNYSLSHSSILKDKEFSTKL